VPGEAAPEGSGGRFTSENAGMSSDTTVIKKKYYKELKK